MGAALLATATTYLLSRVLSWPRPAMLAAAAGGAWLSHVLLDYSNLDTNPPIGIMALWPFDGGFYKLPWPVFLDIGRTLNWATVRHNAVAAAWEIAVLTPLLLAAWWLRHRKRI